MKTPIRLAALSTRPEVHELCARVAQSTSEVVVVLAARDWDELHGIEHDASVVLLDADADDGDAVPRVRELRRRGLRVIAVSRANDPRETMRLMAAGADATNSAHDRSRDVRTNIQLAASRARLIDDHQ